MRLLHLAGFAALLVASSTEIRGTTTAPTTTGLTPLEWSIRMADSEMVRSGTKLYGPPQGKGKWDYTTGMFADALLRLSRPAGDSSYRKTAESTIGSFIDSSGTIATYVDKKKSPAPPAVTANSTPASPTPATPPLLGKAPIPGFSLDKVESGVATLKLYELTHQTRYRKAVETLRDQLRHQPRVDEGGFWHKGSYPDQMWLDGLYMGEPFYADYAVRFGEPEDFADIAKQFQIVGRHTYDPATSLFYHGWDAGRTLPWADPKTGVSPNFWSRAIGWYAMGLVDVLAVMPADDPHRPVLVDLLKKVATGLIKYQDSATGVWWQVTNEGGRANNFLEASSSCMFVYALARGVNEGVLPTSDVPAIRAGYQGILHQFITVDPGGKTISLNRCCQVAGLDSKNKGSYDYYTLVVHIVPNDLKGVAPFITAGIECEKLFGHHPFTP